MDQPSARHARQRANHRIPSSVYVELMEWRRQRNDIWVGDSPAFNRLMRVMHQELVTCESVTGWLTRAWITGAEHAFLLTCMPRNAASDSTDSPPPLEDAIETEISVAELQQIAAAHPPPPNAVPSQEEKSAEPRTPPHSEMEEVFAVVRQPDLAEWLRCAICREVQVAADAQFCKDCGTCICRGDLLEWRNTCRRNSASAQTPCPICRREPVSIAHETPFQVRLLKRVEDEIKVECVHCKEHLSLKDRKEHNRSCSAYMPCFFCCQHDKWDYPRLLKTQFLAHVQQTHRVQIADMSSSIFTWSESQGPIGLIVPFGAGQFMCFGSWEIAPNAGNPLSNPRCKYFELWMSQLLSERVESLDIQLGPLGQPVVVAHWSAMPKSRIFTVSVPDNINISSAAIRVHFEPAPVDMSG